MCATLYHSDPHELNARKKDNRNAPAEQPSVEPNHSVEKKPSRHALAKERKLKVLLQRIAKKEATAEALRKLQRKAG